MTAYRPTVPTVQAQDGWTVRRHWLQPKTYNKMLMRAATVVQHLHGRLM